MANEKRLIYTNAALEKLCEYCNCGDYEECEYRCSEFYNISQIPVVDAVEVVYGTWIDEDDGDWRCSVCRRLYTVDDYGDLHPLDDCGYNYCPNCGAKMDGDEP